MKVTTTQSTCIAAGQCALSAPNVFQQREGDGIVELLNPDPPEDEQDGVREAELLCPSGSIHVEEDAADT